MELVTNVVDGLLNPSDEMDNVTKTGLAEILDTVKAGGKWLGETITTAVVPATKEAIPAFLNQVASGYDYFKRQFAEKIADPIHRLNYVAPNPDFLYDSDKTQGSVDLTKLKSMATREEIPITVAEIETLEDEVAKFEQEIPMRSLKVNSAVETLTNGLEDDMAPLQRRRYDEFIRQTKAICAQVGLDEAIAFDALVEVPGGVTWTDPEGASFTMGAASLNTGYILNHPTGTGTNMLSENGFHAHVDAAAPYPWTSYTPTDVNLTRYVASFSFESFVDGVKQDRIPKSSVFRWPMRFKIVMPAIPAASFGAANLALWIFKVTTSGPAEWDQLVYHNVQVLDNAASYVYYPFDLDPDLSYRYLLYAKVYSDTFTPIELDYLIVANPPVGVTRNFAQVSYDEITWLGTDSEGKRVYLPLRSPSDSYWDYFGRVIQAEGTDPVTSVPAMWARRNVDGAREFNLMIRAFSSWSKELDQYEIVMQKYRKIIPEFEGRDLELNDFASVIGWVYTSSPFALVTSKTKRANLIKLLIADLENFMSQLGVNPELVRLFQNAFATY
jgi:hypothetical protein